MPSFLSHTLILMAILIGWTGAVRSAELPPMILAVHPYLPSTEVQSRFTPLAQYLSKVMNREVAVRVGRDYDEHVMAIGNNSVDIAFMGPSSYIVMQARYGMKPLLARIEVDGKPILGGVIITGKSNDIASLKDLRGRRFAFGDRESTMSALVPEYMLMEAGVPLNTLAGYKYLGGHKNVAFGVLSGDYDAGAVKQEIFEELAPRGLRILAQMPTVSEHLFVTRGDMQDADVQKLRAALLNLHTHPEGKAIMRSINKKMTNMVKVTDNDYDELRGMMRILGVITR